MNVTPLLPQYSARERICALTSTERRVAFKRGAFDVAELNAWAALFPEEVPLVNGELPWIVSTLADLE